MSSIFDHERPAPRAGLPPRSPRGPAPHHVRRRALAGGVLAALLVILVSLVHGDSRSPFGRSNFALTAAERAKLPWAQDYASGSAGPLDGRGLPSPAAQAAAVQRLYRLGQTIYCGGSSGRYATLTFDDGPSPLSANFIRALKKAGAQATYFEIGQSAEAFSATPREQTAVGAVEDHTWRHPFLTHLGTADVNYEVGHTKDSLQRLLGQPVTLFRAPYGAHDSSTDRVVHQHGLLPILWDVDTRDSDGAATPEIIKNAEAGMRPGAIILMHETYDRSLAALPAVLASARKHGLRLVTVPQLLALDPPPESLVRAGPDACSDRERYQRAQDASAMRLARDGKGTAGTAQTTASQTGAAATASGSQQTG